MSDRVLFQMWKGFRQSLIEGHLFYIQQAQKRLLSQFESIEADADKAAAEWLEKSDASFNPDRHDPSDFYEAANDVGIEFYGLLSDMREQTRLSVVAGMFHEWDKQLRDWLAREIPHWHDGENAIAKIWSADFYQIADFLGGFGWQIRNASYFETLDACRLVVNVYKHGAGSSLDHLRQRHPEYFDDPLKDSGHDTFSKKYLDHTNLRVSSEQLQEFSDAILAFWRDAPENIFLSQISAVPDWFEKAVKKDRANQQ